VYNYDYGVFDVIPSRAERQRKEAVERDDIQNDENRLNLDNI